MQSVFFHVDLDAFFASVEQSDNPALRGKPVIIGAAPGHRGVVAACSYEARTFGVRSAMPISEAYRRCPKGVYLPVRMERYHEVSINVMTLLYEFTPEVRQLSVDEASLDMSGTERLFGPPVETARKLKERVRRDTGLTISVGIAPNRYLAKIASERGKPDGLYPVEPGKEIEFLDGLELKDLWGVGKKTRGRLTELGVTSIADLRSRSLEEIQSLMGMGSGAFLYSVVRGEDPGVYREERKSHSISNEQTFERDIEAEEELRRAVLGLSERVMFRLLEERVTAKTVFIKLRYADFHTITAQQALGHPPVTASEIDRAAMVLLRSKWNGGAIRLIGVGISAEMGAPAPTPRQNELFDADLSADEGRGASERTEPQAAERSKRKRLEETVHQIKLQGKPVVKASLLETKGDPPRGPGKRGQ
ncbi:MAG TPA: DNA polymerase IV [Spirochaetia bacterium]|nr:DNA polymerase IV [Spirochaetia bacterium]